MVKVVGILGSGIRVRTKTRSQIFGIESLRRIRQQLFLLKIVKEKLLFSVQPRNVKTQLKRMKLEQ